MINLFMSETLSTIKNSKDLKCVVAYNSSLDRMIGKVIEDLETVDTFELV